MLSFTYIIDDIIKNKTKLVDRIYQCIQDEHVESEHVSLGTYLTTSNEINYIVFPESEGTLPGLFLKLVDIWVGDDSDEVTKEIIEADIDNVIKHLRRLVTANPHI